ncbi:squamous cell carcinoma antigen recognized by T-cells 3 [Tripterygium wilfordii]|uniref:Squamous cell carcinoma antigen recognized by T-cells 3 n=1 Tax=Tripterygium wilfordii TaxID=458696 RepID=A0A7J7CGF5_TRIWF|nr:squamous cell carcinoma antigen recognized by T-cells 3 [Tripterygium wilfordii]KAF5733143.1 squamous cell carcinoma antigen recognized by T-cells 3 [Tripterygium wilfordii]
MEEQTLDDKSKEKSEFKVEESIKGDDLMSEASPQSTKSKEASPAVSSDSDDMLSDSDEDEDEEEGQQKLQLQTLEAELSSNPSNYDTHVQYIKLLRKMAELEKLRQAREAMSALFPLTPEMWQEWAKDEASLSIGHDAVPVIEKLFDRGVLDYLSVPLWCDYIQFIKEYDPSVRERTPDGISKARNLFERAINAAGLHVAEGSKIWEAYREYEQAILHTIDGSDSEVKEKQVQRIQNIFHRQLSVPLSDLTSTLLAYKSWETEQGNILDVGSNNVDGISSKLALSYQKALEMYNARAYFEEQITAHDTADLGKFQHFMTYIKFEQSFGDPSRVQVLYERAISSFPVSSDLWLDYTRYLDGTLKVGKVLRDVYSRASRNCPWVGELWIRYLLSMERGRASEEEIAAVFEKSLQCTFSTLDEYLDLFFTRIDGLRRRISFADEADSLLDFSVIRETFQRASDYFSPHLKNTDGFLRLHAYWARLELKLRKDLTAARGIWESFLKICGFMLEGWLGYIAMEIELGHINEARSIYKRCYSKRFPGTGSEDIWHSWLRFEREFGTLEDLDHAAQKVMPRLEELRLVRLQQESKMMAGSTDQGENHVKKSAREKRKPASNVANEQSPAKRQKHTTQAQEKMLEKDKGEVQKSVEESKVEDVNGVDAKVGDSPKRPIENSEPQRRKVYTDQCTAFISNISLQANEEHIRQFFSDVGGVVSIRILRDKLTRKSRGLAYVDFSDDEHLAAAVARNKQTLLGKKLSIARSNPNQKRKQSVGHNAPKEQARITKPNVPDGGSASKESVTNKQDSNIQRKENKLFVPRNVRPLGWTSKNPRSEEESDEKPKSNDEFRKILFKK